jgi:anti-anti-sigma factor
MAAKRRELEVIKTSADGETLRLCVRGNISRDKANPQPDPLDVVLGADGHKAKVLLNLMEADYIDSGGYSWLLNHNRAFREGGGALVLHSVPPLVMQVLGVMRADLVFQIAPDESIAMTMLPAVTTGKAGGVRKAPKKGPR